MAFLDVCQNDSSLEKHQLVPLRLQATGSIDQTMVSKCILDLNISRLLLNICTMQEYAELSVGGDRLQHTASFLSNNWLFLGQ